MDVVAVALFSAMSLMACKENKIVSDTTIQDDHSVIYCFVDVMPSFPGGETALFR
jgi:hypothetical protein